MTEINKCYALIIAVLNFLKGGIRHFGSLLNVKKFPIKKKIHFFINFGVGIFIAFICHSLQSTTWGESIINKILDVYIESEAKQAVENPQCIEQGSIVFLEIDHDMYVSWGEPDNTPRDKLAQVVKKCYDAGAKVILLDFLFEKKEQMPNDAGDKELNGVLEYIFSKEKVKRDNEKNGNKKTFAGIVFCRRVGFKGDLKRNIFYDFARNLERKENLTIFYQGVSDFSFNANDNIVRYWNSFEKYCGGIKKEDKKEDLIWGIPLISVLLYEDKAIQLESLYDMVLSNKQNNPYSEIDKIAFKNGNEYHLTLNPSHAIFQRIRFKIIPNNEIKEYQENKDNKNEENAFLITAKYNDHLGYIGDEFFRDKIVIIGNSSPDSGDMHRTPVGDLPGMYLLGNAVNTILNTKQIKPPYWWLGYLIELFVITAAAYLFLYLSSFFALFVFVIFISLGLVELGYWYFIKTGYFLNSGLIFIGMVFHKIVADIEDLFNKRFLAQGE